MPEPANVEIVRRGYAAFNNGDTSALAALIAENVVWHVPGRSLIAGDYHGRETTFAYLHRLHLLTMPRAQSPSWPRGSGCEGLLGYDKVDCGAGGDRGVGFWVCLQDGAGGLVRCLFGD
jgi:hypothetical protein